MNAIAVLPVCLRCLGSLVLLLAGACDRAAVAVRAEAQARWQAALARADADPEVQRAATAVKTAEVAMQDARARLGRRDGDSVDAEREQLYQAAAASAVQEHGVLRAAWQELRLRKARAGLSADELKQIESALGTLPGAVNAGPASSK